MGVEIMSKKIVLSCAVCSSRNYSTNKNAANQSQRLEVNKFCKHCQTHTLHRETK
ncbi:50S ribosomal protein L33 [Oceanobacillus sp. M60]|uniref:Large ribosomal subunit protein bL33 n=2 Tax=Oceanobacillus TaxID=182709 RepID=A0ABV9JTF2_9BACI|nr:50S ribosomal protein L33 [Oceanobacillus oncorhynchi]MDM8102150.1 50S ribosomal protein L33 [Oceanobacillus oncorhynchi]UUI40133.1 50S ribosomal protein L33 [Oceanobacillus oncorhynchi]